MATSPATACGSCMMLLDGSMAVQALQWPSTGPADLSEASEPQAYIVAHRRDLPIPTTTFDSGGFDILLP